LALRFIRLLPTAQRLAFGLLRIEVLQAVSSNSIPQLNWAAAHLTVLDIPLGGNAEVKKHGDVLTAIGAIEEMFFHGVNRTRYKTLLLANHFFDLAELLLSFPVEVFGFAFGFQVAIPGNVPDGLFNPALRLMQLAFCVIPCA
jgi:hypothetical protein